MRIFRPAFYLFCLTLFAGCVKPPAPVTSLHKAQEEFERIAREELQYPVVTKMLSRTFWVYIPMKNPMFDFKAAPKLPPGFGKTPQKYAVQFLDGTFHNRTFDIEYDILPATKEGKDYGYSTNYTEEYYKLQNAVLNILTRSFFDLEEKTNTSGEKMPDFFVLVVSDITRGLETRATFHSQDFKKYMTQTLPFDEYSKRYISETSGNADIVNDEKGRYLNFEDITWPDFLTKQIVNRIRFKYQRSDFPPSDDIPTEILRTVAEAIDTYSFNDFDYVKLTDLRTQTEEVFDRTRLAEFPQTTFNVETLSFPALEFSVVQTDQ